jgi:asparagine synthase (glutamine-hydrolysing)
MNTNRILCGWANFGREESPPHAIDAMLSAEGLDSTVAKSISNTAGVISAGSSATSVFEDGEAGVIATILGHPSWDDAMLARVASQNGSAAAAVAAYRSDPAAWMDKVRGSFAAVVIDARRRTATLAIDRCGIERLCFAQRGPLLVFSTSARCVAKHPSVGAGISRQALFEYLYCHMVPSPDTVFEGVEKLLPAECLEISHAGSARRFYWQLGYHQTPHGEADLQQEFVRLTRQAVARHVDARPIGAFLSGGTDSSTVTGLLGQVSGKPPETFSIGFDARGFDELEYARITARHFCANAHEFMVTPAHVIEAIPLIGDSYDEPFGNASAVPTYFCARFARENGVEILLAGDGGDEFFGGNERYAKQGVFEHYYRIPATLRRVVEQLMDAVPPAAALGPVRKAQSYVRQAGIPLPDRLEAYNFMHRSPLREIFEPEFVAAVDTERPMELMRQAYFRCASKEPLERMMHLDHKFTLADNDLRKVTQMCRLGGIDVRFPFMDDDLVRFSGTLRPDQKVRGRHLRVLFKDALKGFLPNATISKSKHGFGLPFGLWLATYEPLRTLVEDALLRLGRRGIVKPAYLSYLLREHSSTHASYFGVMIWVLVQLEYWLQRNSTS